MSKLRYRITYTVPAHDRLSAVMAAGGMLRKGVTVDELVEAIPVYLGWWDVTLAVTETYGADDLGVWPNEQTDGIDASKADLVRWGA